MDNSVIIKGSKSGITVFLDNEMPFEELLESVSDKFKNASKFFNNANMAISFDGRDLQKKKRKYLILYQMYLTLILYAFLMRIMT